MTRALRVAGLVAAAGRSGRMGRCKALLPWGEACFVTHLVDVFASASLGPIVVSVPDGADGDGVRAQLGARDVIVVDNREPQLHAGGSVRAALAALHERAIDVDGLVLTPVDAPGADAPLVRALVHALADHDAAVPDHHGRAGHPVAFARALFARLHDAAAHGGARALLAQLPHVARVAADERALLDVDTPVDLAIAHDVCRAFGAARDPA